MEDEVAKQLKQAELKKEELKQSLDMLTAQSSSLLEVSVRWKAVDAYFESVVKLIVKKREEAVSEIRAREEGVEKRAEEIRVREERFGDLKRNIVDEMVKGRMGLEKWEREIEKREKRVEVVEKEVEERRKEMRLREERVGVLRSGIFGEIWKGKMGLEEREMRVRMAEKGVEEMEREVEERAMRMEEERKRLAKVIDDRMKAMEWRGKRLDHRKNVIDDKVKELEVRELKVEEEKRAVERRAAELEMKEDEMEKEHDKMRRALRYLAEEIEEKTNENDALKEKVLLRTQKLESTAKSSGVSGKSREEESLANQLDVVEVPCTSNAVITLDGRTLQMYVNGMARDDESWQDEVQAILLRLSDPAKIVLDAMEGFYPPHLSLNGKQFDASTVRNTCICLLQKLNNLSPSFDLVLRDEALKLAFEWKEKMTVTEENPLEVTGFLELVMTYGLTKEFDGFELLNLSKIASAKSTSLKLLRDLGCADSISPSGSTPYDANSEFTNTKSSDIAYVQNLISKNQRLQALEYICEFELEDEFPISTMVDIHINYLKQLSKKILEESGNSTAAQEAADFEISGLKDLIKCIENHRLQDRYSPIRLKERIAHLESQYYSKKRAAPCLNSNPHISSAIQNQRNNLLQKIPQIWRSNN